jgi:hypothetical protein
MTDAPALYAVPAVPAVPDRYAGRPLSARELYAISIFSWTKAHPDSTRDEFLAMLERAEARASALGGERA